MYQFTSQENNTGEQIKPRKYIKRELTNVTKKKKKVHTETKVCQIFQSYSSFTNSSTLPPQGIRLRESLSQSLHNKLPGNVILSCVTTTRYWHTLLDLICVCPMY